MVKWHIILNVISNIEATTSDQVDNYLAVKSVDKNKIHQNLYKVFQFNNISWRLKNFEAAAEDFKNFEYRNQLCH